jgi:ribonucleotide monophosphatase NagD (HAD superfamily)
VAGVQVASGRDPEVAGKPFPPTAAAVRARVGEVEVVVGDRLDTDGLIAKLLGVRFALVLTGVTQRSDLPGEAPPDVVAESLADLVPQ